MIDPSSLLTADDTLESLVCNSFDAGYSSRVESEVFEAESSIRGEVGWRVDVWKLLRADLGDSMISEVRISGADEGKR